MAKKRKLETKKEIEVNSTHEEAPVEEPIDESTREEANDDGVEEVVKQDTVPESESKPELPDPSSSSLDGNGATPASSVAAVVDSDEEDEDDSDPASIQKLLETFPKDQLVDILRDAVVRHRDVLADVRRFADADPALRKIFVHGLGWDTNADTLAAAFREYGKIEDCKAVVDKLTGKSKGYGFILFKRRSGARRALMQPQKRIGNRMTACQLASAGPAPPPAPAPPPVSEYTLRKIFVSNVGADIDPQKLLQFFARYGEIEEGPLGLDKATGRPKGFALFVYKTVESARKALEEPHKNFEGHTLHCQKAIDGPKPGKGGFHQGGAHGSHFGRNESSGFGGGMGSHIVGTAGTGHLMAPPATGLGFNQAAPPAAAAAAAAAGLNPALGQALTAILASQGQGLGLSNLLGSLGTSGVGSPAVNHGVPSGGHGMHGVYGNQGQAVGNPGMLGGYGAAGAMQGGYGNVPTGQGGSGRNQQGLGHLGGAGPYMGH
ncbi:RNA-binding protein P-like [Typha latifolia]|uniref:RNA-binding protein P-like n=1 Tax=Typha latifolia TaxID=4733 RepID=UPI003C30D64B